MFLPSEIAAARPLSRNFSIRRKLRCRDFRSETPGWSSMVGCPGEWGSPFMPRGDPEPRTGPVERVGHAELPGVRSEVVRECSKRATGNAGDSREPGLTPLGGIPET